MAGKEIVLDRLPRLDYRSAIARDKIRTLDANYTPNPQRKKSSIIDRDIFGRTTHGQDAWTVTPDIEYLTRLARRETIVNRPREKVGRYGNEWDHEQPALIANSAISINTLHGGGWLPFEASMALDPVKAQKNELYRAELAEIKEVYIVQHGVMRNATDYFDYFMKALGKEYDPRTMLVIAPQFCAPVDLKNPKTPWTKMRPGETLEVTNNGFKVKSIFDEIKPEEVLRWRYNDWRGAEPALNADAPIDSFTAMDNLVEIVTDMLPNVEKIEFRGNSEGGQFLDRYLAFSKTLNKLEFHDERKIDISGILSNPGSLLYFDTIRPLFDNSGKIIGWKEYPSKSPENRWPFGMDDVPPYILESLDEWPDREEDYYGNKEQDSEDPLDFAIRNYLRRTILAIGQKDDIVGGFHLPKGPGPAYYAQGDTRFRRMKAKIESLTNFTQRKPHKSFPDIRWLIIPNVEHDAWEIFNKTEIYQPFTSNTVELFGTVEMDH